MARRRYNDFYQPEVVDPGVIDFGAIQMYNPEDTARLAQVGQNMQQRWDASQTTIAKYLEDIGVADIDPKIKDQVVLKLEDDLNQLYGRIGKDYGGDAGAALHPITQQLSKSRGLMHQATQATLAERKAFDEYNKAVQSGNAPQVWEGNGFRTLKFDEINQPLSFDEKTGTVSFQQGAMRGKSDAQKFIASYMIPAIMGTTNEKLPVGMNATQANAFRALMYKMEQTKGMDKQQVLNRIKDYNLADTFINNAPFIREEFTDAEGNFNEKAAEQYFADTLLSMASQSKGYQIGNIPQPKETIGGKSGFKILSPASVNADITQNPFLEERKQTYTSIFKDYQVPWFAEMLGAKREYTNIEDLSKVYETRAQDIIKEVARNTQNGELKDELTEAINAGSNSMIGAMLGKVLATYVGAGTAGLAILPLTLRGDKRPLDLIDIEMVQNAITSLNSVKEDIKVARENLEKGGVDTKNLTDVEIAKYLDQDYTLRSKTQDTLYLPTVEGAKALTNMYNNNPLGKLSGGFRTAESSEMLPLDVLAKKIGADHQELQAQVMDSKQWNYNLDTGEFGMKLKIDDKKDKTFYFTLDNVTTNISEGIKYINSLESNPSKKRELDLKIQQDGRGIHIGGSPGVYDIQYTGGKNPYSVIYKDVETGETDIFEDLDATQVKLFTKDNVIDPYLNFAYGEK